MSQRFLSGENRDNMGYPIIGANSVVFSHADPVYIDSNGFLALATAGSRVIGFALGSQTMAATNETVAKVKPEYIKAEKVVMAFPSDQDCTQTDVGAYADFGTATTGAFNINLAATTAGQVIVLGFDPNGESDNDDVVCVIAEPQISAAAQV